MDSDITMSGSIEGEQAAIPADPGPGAVSPLASVTAPPPAPGTPAASPPDKGGDALDALVDRIIARLDERDATASTVAGRPAGSVPSPAPEPEPEPKVDPAAPTGDGIIRPPHVNNLLDRLRLAVSANTVDTVQDWLRDHEIGGFRHGDPAPEAAGD